MKGIIRMAEYQTLVLALIIKEHRIVMALLMGHSDIMRYACILCPWIDTGVVHLLIDSISVQLGPLGQEEEIID